MRRCTATVAALALASLAACSPATVPDTNTQPSIANQAIAPWKPQGPRPALPAFTQQQMMESRAKDYSQVAGLPGAKDIKDIPVIQWITDETEGATLRSKCLQDKGWKAEAHGAGVRIDNLPKSQEIPYKVSLAECFAQYPGDSRYLAQMTPDQWSIVYDYKTQWLGKCLTIHGWSADEPSEIPTKETYLATPDDKKWMGYEHVPSEDQDNARSACPALPDLDLLWN